MGKRGRRNMSWKKGWRSMKRMTRGTTRRQNRYKKNNGED